MEKQQVTSVTRSYSRTIQVKQFEPAQFFASRSYSWFKEPTQEEVAEKSQELYDECVREVEAEVSIVKGPTEIEQVNLDLDEQFRNTVQ